MRRKVRAATAALAVAVAFLVAVPAAALAAPNVWINEIHYDNAGVDAGEGVELAGPAGTDLTGWRIELYNGFDARMYATHLLSGALVDQRGGFGTQWVPMPGLQNGPSDGIALVDGSAAIVEFLSYEGVLTPIGGSAGGLASTTIVPFEHPSTPAGRSLQLAGTGARAGDFTWSAARAASPGAVNDGQDFPPPAGGAADGVPPTSSGPEDPPEPAELTLLRVRRRISVARAAGLHLGRIRYAISRPATVSFAIAPLLRDGPESGLCRALTPQPFANNCGRAGPVVGIITDVGEQGRNTVGFAGRLAGRPLPSGLYLLAARVGTGAERYASFRVTRAPLRPGATA